MRTPSRGFTLIELMIGMAVAAVIVSIAVPSFMGQVRQSRRVDAMDAAAAVQQAQERWRANNISYTASLSDLGHASTTGMGYYTLALSAASGTGYTLTVTAVSSKSQASDSGCSTLTVQVANGVPTPGPASCWKK